jgi:predicted ATPase with chaperone activity
MADLALKVVYFAGNATGGELSERLALPLNVANEVLALLRKERLCDVSGGTGLTTATLSYTLTSAGLDRAAASLQMSGYAGPAPIPLDRYFESVHGQTIQDLHISREQIESSLADLVFDQHTIDLIGAALSSRKATLLYGASGNGKSTAADCLKRALTGEIVVPYAVEVMHQVIQVYDPSTHEVVEDAPTRAPDGTILDRRWIRIKRPLVLAAGELAASHLELVLDDVARTYEAPIQMKANGGMLVIDDFGRQQLDAAYLLNRWIVPLEKGVDNLSLHSGTRFQVPFDVIPLFITNRNPADLADDAFLRRIRYKVEVPSPDTERFIEILKRECAKHHLEYDDDAAAYMVDVYFGKPGREMRGCHPRDIVEAIAAAGEYKGSAHALNRETIDAACSNYFV